MGRERGEGKGARRRPWQREALFPREGEDQARMTGVVVVSSAGCKGGGGGKRGGEEERRSRAVLELLLAAVRRSVVACRVERGSAGASAAGWPAEEDDEGDEAAAVELGDMEIGWPTDVRHVAHVTFDRFHGFLGLPVEFEVEMPCRVPSAR